jgi:hypothetical protein
LEEVEALAVLETSVVAQVLTEQLLLLELEVLEEAVVV